jgi:beta-lactamase regulating signal transducer with metallopeptidase domain
MHLPNLEEAYFLQSLGLSIGHSFWQVGILWLFYQLIITTDRKLPANVKYNISIGLIISSFIWFVGTLSQTYFLLLNNNTASEFYYIKSWIFKIQLNDFTFPFLSITYLLLLIGYILSFCKKIFYNPIVLKEGLKKAPIDFRIYTNKVALQLGIKKKIQVWMSEYVDVPSVTGVLKPIILLPAAIANHLSIQQIESILLHELAHIKRNDYLLNIIQSAVEVVLFFNPFVKALGQTAKKERENCCDDCVMNFQYDKFEYAKALVSLEEYRQFSGKYFTMTATNGKKNLLKRITRLFNTQPTNRLNIIQRVKLAISGACLFLITFISLLISGTHYTNDKSKNRLKVNDYNAAFVANMQTDMAYKTELNNRIEPPLLEPKTTSFSRKRKSNQSPKKSETEYVDAYINEDLLAPTERFDAIPSQAAELEVPNSNYIIKVEEQQSGKKQISIYYFELKNVEGETAIKPLIIMNKSTKKATQSSPKTPKDSLSDSSNKQRQRKRITT